MRPVIPPLHPSFPGTTLAPGMRAALYTLLTARQYAELARRDLWEFAVEMRALVALGVTGNEMRWLVHQGYVQHARETTQPGSPQRQFTPIANFMIPDEACFVLTDQGWDLVQLAFGPAIGGAPASVPANGEDLRLVPRWDPAARELIVGGLVVKRFKQPAPSQETILSAFAEEGWPTRIDDPLPPLANRDAKRHLHDTINNLNRHQQHPLVRFLGDGKGEGICWQLRFGAPTPELHQRNLENEV